MTSASRVDQLPRLAVLLLVLALPAVLFPNVVSEAAALHELAGGAHPYLVPPHGLLLYIAVPLVVISATVLFMGPGLCLTFGRPRSETLSGWLLSGFMVSLVVAVVVTTAATLLHVDILHGRLFGLVGLGTLLVAALLPHGLTGASRSMRAPVIIPAARWALGLSIGAVVTLTILLLPKFFWEDFNGDGVHAFLSSRLLLSQGWPFWPSEAGPLAAFPGVTSMLFAWPNVWFMRLFGEHEASVRLPFLLYLPVLAAALVAVAEHGQRPLGRAAWTALWSGLVAFTIAMAFSATYSPYHADLAMPAAQDTLMMVCLVGWLHAWLRQEWWWTFLFSMATVASLPSGPLLMGFWLMACLVSGRPAPWRPVAAGGAILIGCVAVVGVLPRVLAAAGVPHPGTEYDVGSLTHYFKYLQFTEWTRLGYVALPAGLFPVVVLGWWRRQDRVAKGLTLVTLAYFLFFFIQAHISLHHFVPAMLLPVIVAARSAPTTDRGRRRYFATWQCAALTAVAWSLPSSFKPHITDRYIGTMVSVSMGNYDSSDPAIFRAGELLTNLVPLDWEASVPDSSYGGSPLVWLHYAHHAGAQGTTDIVLAPAAWQAPAGMLPVTASADAVLYLRDLDVGASLRALRPQSSVAAIYAVQRGILWHGQPLPNGPRIYSSEAIRRRLARLLRTNEGAE